MIVIVTNNQNFVFHESNTHRLNLPFGLLRTFFFWTYKTYLTNCPDRFCIRMLTVDRTVPFWLFLKTLEPRLQLSIISPWTNLGPFPQDALWLKIFFRMASFFRLRCLFRILFEIQSGKKENKWKIKSLIIYTDTQLFIKLRNSYNRGAISDLKIEHLSLVYWIQSFGIFFFFKFMANVNIKNSNSTLTIWNLFFQTIFVLFLLSYK